MANNRNCKRAVLGFVIAVNIFDLISDWTIYTGELLNKDGLVFGPYDRHIVDATLVFCVIATVTFVVEFFLDIYNHNKKSETVELAVEILAVVTLLIEDLPLIGINLHIAFCRQRETNIIQIIKASTAILEPLVKLSIMAIKICRNNCKLKKKITEAKKIRQVLNFLILILLAINLILSILLVLTTMFDSLRLDEEVKNGYQQDVGIFMTVPNMADNEWIRLTDLKTITQLSSPTQGLFLSVMVTAAPLQYIWIRKHFPGSPESLSCYHGNSSSAILLPPNDCSNILPTTETTTVSMRFTYIHPSTYQPMGDIHYNLEVRQGFHQILTNETVSLKYFKVRPAVRSDLALTTTENDSHYQFYREDSDLLSTHEVWKTGTSRCGNTGRESPKLDSDLFVRCVF
ncbi:uncharacterized protein [Argopecten irradians]|uniref:uncharacterized protein n=1 Tax=Argopecten irradians TaxID=31199 RepID=UPI003721EEB0